MSLDSAETRLCSPEVLNSRSCRVISRELNDFENSFFGPDFICDHHRLKLWMDSGCYFTAALRACSAGQPELIASASIFVTHSLSREALFRGRIVDTELEPWFFGPPGSVPTLYAASMVSASREHRQALYASLLSELIHYFSLVRLEVRSGFAIASTHDGYRHLSNIGFHPVPDVMYKGKYEFMSVNPPSARNGFWRNLLDSAQRPVLRTQSSLNLHFGQRPAAIEFPVCRRPQWA